MGEEQTQPSAEESHQRSIPPAQPAETISSEELFHGMREVRIRHAGEVYRLRVTRSGKLILHK